MTPTIQPPQKNKKSARPLRSYLTNNLVLKILSLIFAVILWNFVITETNPARTKNIAEITVTANGADELASRGLIPRDDHREAVGPLFGHFCQINAGGNRIFIDEFVIRVRYAYFYRNGNGIGGKIISWNQPA